MNAPPKSSVDSVPEDLRDLIRKLVAGYPQASAGQQLTTLNLVLKLSLSRDVSALVLPSKRIPTA